MSLIRWLHGSSSLELEENEDGPTIAANKEIEKMKQVGRKRERYHHNNDETHVKIAKYSCECGSNAAADKFTKELGFLVTKSTVRNMKKCYLSILRKEKDPERI